MGPSGTVYLYLQGVASNPRSQQAQTLRSRFAAQSSQLAYPS
ncbi:MAG: hypothetical protein AAFZ49_05510 [Cyanobacteria bacterium J06659_2]